MLGYEVLMNAPAPKIPKLDLTLLKHLVEGDLARVNQVILAQGKSEIPLINEIASHIIASGGKRLRPCLTIAAAKLCGYEGERHVHLAACVEFLHTATLLHDDVIDESHMRRGAPTANDVFGNKSSVLVGDFLFTRAFQLMVADGSLEVLKIISDASAIITAGEVQQMVVSHDLGITQAIYEEVVAAKTAALFAAACELGAIVTAKPEWQKPLRDYGHALGMAFQLVDDALDYQANEAELGKTIGDDFREGKVTLPVIIAYANATADEQTFWKNTMESGEDITPELLQRAKELLVKHHAFEKTLAIAEAFASDARNALAVFPDSPAKAALIEAADFTTQRGY